MKCLEFTEIAGERIGKWVEKHLTYENGCKRDWEDGDGFEPDEVDWVFTQKGMKKYEGYVRRVNKLIKLKYPNEKLYEDLEMHTGVIYP